MKLSESANCIQRLKRQGTTDLRFRRCKFRVDVGEPDRHSSNTDVIISVSFQCLSRGLNNVRYHQPFLQDNDHSYEVQSNITELTSILIHHHLTVTPSFQTPPMLEADHIIFYHSLFSGLMQVKNVKPFLKSKGNSER